MQVHHADMILASILTSYPDEGFAEDVQAILKEGDARVPAELERELLAIVADPGKLADLRSEYLSLFDGGRGVSPLYETEYGRRRSFFKANELATIAGFYRAFGFELGGEDMAREMPDHLSVEFEFYALLKMKEEYLEAAGDREGVEIVHEARAKFLKEHLGRFVPAVLQRPGIAESAWYGAILRHCDQLLRAECEALGVQPEKAEWVEGESEGDEIACGAACLK